MKASKSMSIINTILLLTLNLNNGGDIRISIESQDAFAHPSESYLIFEGRLTKADNTAYASADEVALTNNTIMHLIAELSINYQTSLLNHLTNPVRQLPCLVC